MSFNDYSDRDIGIIIIYKYIVLEYKIKINYSFNIQYT